MSIRKNERSTRTASSRVVVVFFHGSVYFPLLSARTAPPTVFLERTLPNITSCLLRRKVRALLDLINVVPSYFTLSIDSSAKSEAPINLTSGLIYILPPKLVTSSLSTMIPLCAIFSSDVDPLLK